MTKAFLATVWVALGLSLNAQSPDPDPKQRMRQVREQSKLGEDGISAIGPMLGDTDVGVRVEAAKALVTIGGPKTLDPLLRATADNDPEVQIRATDGLVNIYLPGYVKNGLSGTLSRAGTTIRTLKTMARAGTNRSPSQATIDGNEQRRCH